MGYKKIVLVGREMNQDYPEARWIFQEVGGYLKSEEGREEKNMTGYILSKNKHDFVTTINASNKFIFQQPEGIDLYV